MSNFTVYWRRSTWHYYARQGQQGQPLDHAASKQFIARGVRVGDRLYVVSIEQGAMHLIGRMEVGAVVSQAVAERTLGREVWDAPDHVLGKKGTCSPMRFDRVVPIQITKQLEFEAGGKYRSPVFRSSDCLDGQTLRGIRRITDASAALLESELR